MPPTVAVEIGDLVKRYGERTAVSGLSFSVPVARITAVLGPNGAGKTTTLEICEGYRRPDAGTVRVLGRDPWRDRRELAPRLGVMLQSGGVYPGVPAMEMLRHVAALHAHPLDPGMLAERLGLARDRTPFRRLSGGQQQRLSLALALVGRPELVFLDEPTAGMDPQARHATWELLRELRTDGVSAVVTTHFMDEAEQLADQVVVIDRGRAVAIGTPAELMHSGGCVRFRAEAGLDCAALAAEVPRVAAAREAAPGAYLVEGQVDPRLVADLTAWCAERGVLATDLTVGHRSLEDVFLELTGEQVRP